MGTVNQPEIRIQPCRLIDVDVHQQIAFHSPQQNLHYIVGVSEGRDLCRTARKRFKRFSRKIHCLIHVVHSVVAEHAASVLQICLPVVAADISSGKQFHLVDIAEFP